MACGSLTASDILSVVFVNAAIVSDCVCIQSQPTTKSRGTAADRRTNWEAVQLGVAVMNVSRIVARQLLAAGATSSLLPSELSIGARVSLSLAIPVHQSRQHPPPPLSAPQK